MKEKSKKSSDKIKAALEKVRADIDAINADLKGVQEIEDDNERADRLFEVLQRLDKVGTNGDTQ